MEKEKLSEQLKEGLGKTSLSDRTIESYAEKIASQSIPENVDDYSAFLSNHVDFLRTMEGQVSFEVASKVKSTDKYADKPTAVANERSGMDGDKLSELEKQIACLGQFMNDAKAEKQQRAEQEQKTAILNAAIESARGQGVVDKVVLDLILPIVEHNVQAASTKEDIAAMIKAKYDETYSKLRGEGYSPASANSGISTLTAKNKDDYMNHLKATGRI